MRLCFKTSYDFINSADSVTIQPIKGLCVRVELQRFIWILTVAFILAVAGSGSAWAQAASAQQGWAPWMTEFKLGENNPIERPEKSNKKIAAKKNTIPDDPILTPDDTRKIAEKLELGEAVLPPKPSPLEEIYSDRIVEELKQFGYDMFGSPDDANAKDTAEMPAGAVQDDFILSSGDKLDIIFRGQKNTRQTLAIDSQGLLLLDEMPPIEAAGRSIGQVRDELQSSVAQMHNTEIFVSLSSVRQAGVTLIGHVKHPGRQTLTVFHTVLDALTQAGGVEKTGSLRQIKLVRNGRGVIVDLYGLLIHGSAGMDLTLRDGDRIIVPPIGPTVAVAGGVKRPAIYEILPALNGMLRTPQDASRKVTLEDMLDLGGGVLQAGRNRFMSLGLTEDGRETINEIQNTSLEPIFGDGSILMVAPDDDKRSGTVELVGETRRPGLHALGKAENLSSLLDDPQVFGADIYPLMGVIERWDEKQLAKQLIAFPPRLVTQGQFDRKLQDGDVVHLFSRKEILALNGDTPPEKTEEGSSEEDEPLDPILHSFLTEHAVHVRGAVRQAADLPVADGATLDSVIAVAGGLTLEADTSNVEITSNLQGEGLQTDKRSGTQRLAVNFQQRDPASVSIGAGDAVRVNQKFKQLQDGSVLIIGEVVHAGRYDLMPGDTMASLLKRAGGLTPQAYPDGAVFSRESERKAESSRFQAQARDLEARLAAAIQHDEKSKPDATQIAAVQGVIDELKQAEAVGRITVETDPGVLAAQPELDMLLEPGDRLFIPKRPLTVRVAGEILSPANLQFRTGKDPTDYIDQAGGFTWHADKDRTFVIYPDGSAQPLQVNDWNHQATFIPPGSTIVVPRDPKPFDFLETTRDISQILANLAFSAVVVDDVRDN